MVVEWKNQTDIALPRAEESCPSPEQEGVGEPFAKHIGDALERDTPGADGPREGTKPAAASQLEQSGPAVAAGLVPQGAVAAPSSTTNAAAPAPGLSAPATQPLAGIAASPPLMSQAAMTMPSQPMAVLAEGRPIVPGSAGSLAQLGLRAGPEGGLGTQTAELEGASPTPQPTIRTGQLELVEKGGAIQAQPTAAPDQDATPKAPTAPAQSQAQPGPALRAGSHPAPPASLPALSAAGTAPEDPNWTGATERSSSSAPTQAPPSGQLVADLATSTVRPSTANEAPERGGTQTGVSDQKTTGEHRPLSQIPVADAGSRPGPAEAKTSTLPEPGPSMTWTAPKPAPIPRAEPRDWTLRTTDQGASGGRAAAGAPHQAPVLAENREAPSPGLPNRAGKPAPDPQPFVLSERTPQTMRESPAEPLPAEQARPPHPLNRPAADAEPAKASPRVQQQNADTPPEAVAREGGSAQESASETTREQASAAPKTPVPAPATSAPTGLSAEPLSAPPPPTTAPSEAAPPRYPSSSMPHAPLSELVQELSREANIQLLQRGSQVRLQLVPGDLGRVEMEIQSRQDHAIVAIVRVENDAAKQALESRLQSLAAALERNGIALADLQVSVGGQERWAEKHQPTRSRNEGTQSTQETPFLSAPPRNIHPGPGRVDLIA